MTFGHLGAALRRAICLQPVAMCVAAGGGPYRVLVGGCFVVMLLGMTVSQRAVAPGMWGRRRFIGVLPWVKPMIKLLCCVCWHADGLGLAAQRVCTGQVLSAV